MKQYKKINNSLGWLIFAIASVVYIITSEPTASFWDCGEYIATAYKMQVGHPPGAPLFQIIGRFFSLFALGNTSMVARMINTMSALSSGFTILFLFWSITMLAKKLVVKTKDDITKGEMLAIFGSGIVGALAYTFSDSFWFSAVEGEVYAMASLFTAVVFWAILKWETLADQKHSLRWIILISYLIGLSIGVHLLSLLAIPSIVFVVYFRKYKTSKKGIIITAILSFIILGFVQSGIIPWVIALAGKFELFFVNTIRLPFNSGTIIYFILIIVLIILGLKYTQKHKKVILNTIILCFTFMLIGYSTFFILVIRSNANPPINENSPKNAISLLSYLNREQYGDWPKFYGQYYNAPLDKNKPYKDGNPVYTKDMEKGIYIIIDSKKSSIPNYDKNFCTLFPRMWSPQSNHIKGYKSWGKVEGTPITITGQGGRIKTIYKPKFSENLRFFFSYQLGFMYFRYFMWNFAGRQNDIQGYGGVLNGNWISGIKWLDEMRLGPQHDLPDSMTENRARNKLFLLPFILGIIGFLYQLNRGHKDFIVVLLFFLFTGLAINVYLNIVPYQPRERDYAYAGSFYVYAIWIGLGVLALYDVFKKAVKPAFSAIIATLLCLVLVPYVMAKEEWDDHDRSGRYTCRDFAANYLNSCAPNAILFTNGDNDTFPLWYDQEVEGIRTDVRVVNLSLLNTDWYIDQMKRKAYDSESVPFSMTKKQYRQGTRDVVYIQENPNVKGYINLRELINFVASDDAATKLATYSGKDINYFPTKKFRIPVDSATVVKNGTVSKKEVNDIAPAIEWKFKKNYVQKNHLMVLDLLATNNWKRPVYFAITTGGDSYIGLENYFQLQGLAYRLVPVKTKSIDGQTGSINTKVMYDNLMNKFKWGNIQNPHIYLNQDNMRMIMNFRNNFARLANNLIIQGKKDSAIAVCDRCIKVMPEKTIPYDYFILPIAETYYKAGKIDKANKITEKLIYRYEQELRYYSLFENEDVEKVKNEAQRALSVIYRINRVTTKYKQEILINKSDEILKKYYPDK